MKKYSDRIRSVFSHFQAKLMLAVMEDKGKYAQNRLHEKD